MQINAEKHFKQKFGMTPTYIVQAPGRLELLGNHTDYNAGLVMSIAVDKHIEIAVSPRNDGKIEMCSTAFSRSEVFYASDLKKNPSSSWTNYSKGVLEELRKRKIGFTGFNAAIHGTLPIGAGMSSSAALEVATALAVRELFPYTATDTGCEAPPVRDRDGKLPPLTHEQKLVLAKICQAAENKFVGVNCGLLDQISSLFGRAAHAITIDCQSLTVGNVPMVGDIAVVVCNSNVKHALIGGEYNELRQQCEAAAKALGVKFLRAVDMPTLQANKSKLTERQYQCAYHVVGENQRVAAGEKALRANDFEQFGQYMFQSHESSRDFFHNSTKELDLLVAIAREHPAILGARLTGGGFGGATINLVKRDGMKAFMDFMAAEYEKRSGHRSVPMLCQIVDGAR
jgi:galactokinase